MGKIIPGEPLPKHTKLDYDECYAKVVLEKVFPERYSNLQISDKPDLRDESNTIGIEVTSAIPQSKRESVSLWADIESQTAKNPERNKARMKQLGVTYTGGVQGWPATVYPTGCFDKSPFVDVIDVIQGKIEKLNSGEYASLGRYDLYVETELFVERGFLPEILNRVLKINTMSNTYAYIYMICVNGICAFDLIQKTYEVRKILFEQYDLAIEARNFVERAETE